jgi:hypothetical protein
VDEASLEKQPAKPVPSAQPVMDAEPAMRASDADRDRITDILREALAEGRLTAEEHAERIDAVYAAKTLGELRPLVRDLPAPGTRAEPTAGTAYASPPGPVGPVAPVENLIAVMSSSTRRGRWRVSPRTKVFAVFGNVEIDLTEAIFEQQHSVIHVVSVFGNVEIQVPENITLRGTGGTGVFGNYEIDTMEAADPQSPTVVISGYSVFGNIEAKPRRGKLVRDLQTRLRKHLGH